MKSQNLSRWVTAHYALIQVLFNTLFLAVFGFSSVYLRAHGFVDAQIGVIMALGTVLNFVVQPFLGSFADRIHLGLNRLLAIFFGCAALVAVVMTQVSQPLVVVGALFMLLHFGINVSEALGNSLAMEQVNRGINLNFGLARGIGSVGYAVASLLMGRFIAQRTESAIMPVVIVVSLLCVLVLLPFGGKNAKLSQQEKKNLNLREFIRENKRFCVFVIGVALMYYCYSVRAGYMYQIVLAVGGDVDQFGKISAFTAFVELPAMAAYPLLSKKFSGRSIVLFAAVCFVIRTLVICFAQNMAWIYVSQAMQMVSYALFIPASVYYVNSLIGESDRNKGQTFLGMGMSLSSICASLLGGVMLTAAGGNPQTMLLTAAIISTVGVIILAKVKPGQKA